jgi:hypothetical protein
MVMGKKDFDMELGVIIIIIIAVVAHYFFASVGYIKFKNISL